MMRRLSCMMVLLTIVTSCAGLPRINPFPQNSVPSPPGGCSGGMFLSGKWQLVHSIEATLPGGNHILIMGVSIIAVEARTIQCVIMTIEGLVLFEATYDKQIVITRSIDQFDSQRFATGLLNDIQLIFFPPDGPLTTTGTLANGLPVCRYRTSNRKTIDIIFHDDATREMRLYTKRGRLSRNVRLLSIPQAALSEAHVIPDRIELRSAGLLNYALDLNLVEALNLDE